MEIGHHTSENLKKSGFGIKKSFLREVDALLSVSNSTPLAVLTSLKEKYKGQELYSLLPSREQIASRRKSLRVTKQRGPDGSISNKASYENYVRRHRVSSKKEWEDCTSLLLIFDFDNTGVFSVEGENDDGETVTDTGFIFGSKQTFLCADAFIKSSNDVGDLAVTVLKCVCLNL